MAVPDGPDVRGDGERAAAAYDAIGEVGYALNDAPADDPVARSSRIGRTAVQVGIPAAIVTIGVWAARLAGVDLDPGPGTDLPPDVVAAFVAVVGTGIAWRMNRRPR